MALIFDFDDTLVPDSTTWLLKEHGVDTNLFWEKEAKKLILQGYDPGHAYLKLVLDLIRTKKSLQTMTNKDLRKFGSALDSRYYMGLPKMFKDVKNIADQHDIQIEFFVISGGLKEVIIGSKIIQEYFAAVYGSELVGDSDGGPLKYIKRCMTFSEKIRYLTEINKGIKPEASYGSPYLVNQSMSPNKRRIPFRNMIYVGDGLTDIPCFSLVQKEGGMAFGIFDPTEQKSAKRALQDFMMPNRVMGMYAPKYRPNDELGSLIRSAVQTKCNEINLRSKETEANL